jgi:predicted nucleic acid-binding protein
MPVVLLDTGVWISLCDDDDDVVPRSRVSEIADELERFSILVPWPVCHEVLRTRFVKNRKAMDRFVSLAARPGSRLMSDAAYIADAYRECIAMERRNRPLSLVDCLLRRVLRDPANRIERLYTFNERDFHDVVSRSRTVMVGKA